MKSPKTQTAIPSGFGEATNTHQVIQDANARAAQAFLTTSTSRRKSEYVNNNISTGKRASVNATSTSRNNSDSALFVSSSVGATPSDQERIERAISRSLNDLGAHGNYIQQNQQHNSPDRSSLFSPDVPTGTGELANINTEPVDHLNDGYEYINQTGLDLEAVICHFEEVHEKIISNPYLLSKTQYGFSSNSTYPRYTFYSEKTGVIRSNFWDVFDISTLDGEKDNGSVRDTLTTCPFWIDIASPTHQEMAAISKVFNLHPLTTEDIQTPDTREKCEVFQRYYFVVIRSFEQDQFKHNFLHPITVNIVIFDECILSFQTTANPHSRNVRSRIDQLSSYGHVSITTEWINYALIDDITDSFIPLLKVIELEVDSIEELVLIPVMKNDYVDMDMLRRIGMVRKRVMQLLRLISTKADVVKTIISRYMNQQEPSPQNGSALVETKFYLEDIHDHVLTMMQNLNHYEKSLARSHSNYLAQISIDITQASNRTSDTVMRMTLLASILVPLNVITGLFGMNVRVPGENGSDLTWFVGIIAFMAGLTTLIYYIAKRHKLI